jgi:uncharacterized protein (DUF58 family)
VTRRVPVPASLSGPGVVLTCIAIALYVIARSTGAGWDIVVLCALLAVMLVAAVWPAVALVTVGVVVATPSDGTAGRSLPVTLTLTGRAAGLRVRLLTGPSTWHRADAPSHGTVGVVPQRRGVFTGVVAEVRSASPLGLLAWRRRIEVTLDRPLEVAPRPLTVRYEPALGSDREAHARPRTSATGHEITRGVREYVDGDPIRLVHWPATARTGSVMVRELEGPQRTRLLVVVDLRAPNGDDDAVEIAASRALGLVLGAIDRGTLVEVATVEADGPRTAPVRTPLEAGRRLARAIEGPPGPVAAGPGVDVRYVRAGAGA